MSAPALYQACRRMFDSLTQGSSHLCGTKQVGIINAHLGSELVMSLVIGDRGDLLMLQIAGRNVRVFADPSKWSGQEVEGGSKAEVRSFLRTIERRRQNRRRSGHRHR